MYTRPARSFQLEFMASSPLESLNLQDLGAAAVREKLNGDSARTILIPIGSCERHGNPFTPLK